MKRIAASRGLCTCSVLAFTSMSHGDPRKRSGWISLLTPTRLLAATLLAFVCQATVQAAQVPLLSDGSDGVFAPLNSLVLYPEADGIFNFTTVDIAPEVLVSVDRESYAGDVYLLATGDITIHGALDSGSGALHLHTPGTVYLDGKVYGESIHVAYGQFHAVNNPNGNPDQHRSSAGSLTLYPDGELPVEPDTAVETVNAAILAGVTISAQMWVPPYLIRLPNELMLTTYFSPPANVPLPGALPLLVSALGLAGLALSRRK